MRYLLRFLYAIFMVAAGLVSWFYNRSVIYLIVHMLLGPLYLFYKWVMGDFTNGYWRLVIDYYW